MTFSNLTVLETRQTLKILMEKVNGIPQELLERALKFLEDCPDDLIEKIRDNLDNLLVQAQERDIKALSQTLQKVGIPTVLSVIVANQMIRAMSINDKIE